jgi:stress-induced morphogen
MAGGCPGGTLEVEIHSPLFVGKSELQRHRMVNTALKPEIALFHAFVLRPFPSKE